MATIAIVIQLDGGASVGADMMMSAWYTVGDTVALTAIPRSVYEIPLPIASPKTWKSLIVNAVIADAAANGYTVTAAGVRFVTYEPGDFRYTDMVAAWTKDITKTNIGSTRVNIYAGLAGEPQLIDFANFTQYRLSIGGNKVGTGNLTHGMYEQGTEANALEQIYSGAAGEFSQDSGWLNLPAWANNEKIMKPMALSSVATDDPIYRNCVLYLR